MINLVRCDKSIKMNYCFDRATKNKSRASESGTFNAATNVIVENANSIRPSALTIYENNRQIRPITIAQNMNDRYFSPRPFLFSRSSDICGSHR